jgi:hypothetical protein
LTGASVLQLTATSQIGGRSLDDVSYPRDLPLLLVNKLETVIKRRQRFAIDPTLHHLNGSIRRLCPGGSYLLFVIAQDGQVFLSPVLEAVSNRCARLELDEASPIDASATHADLDIWLFGVYSSDQVVVKKARVSLLGTFHPDGSLAEFCQRRRKRWRGV